MKSYFHKFADLDFGWNERELTDQDFFHLCRRFGIIADVQDIVIRGMHYRLLGRDFISISNRLSPLQKSFVMFHELGHFLMHAPNQATVASFSGLCPESREEQEANAFAFCSMLPLSILRTREPEELADIFGSRFLMARLGVYDRYGI